VLPVIHSVRSCDPSLMASAVDEQDEADARAFEAARAQGVRELHKLRQSGRFAFTPKCDTWHITQVAI
jgi:hypothetical protein